MGFVSTTVLERLRSMLRSGSTRPIATNTQFRGWTRSSVEAVHEYIGSQDNVQPI